MPELTFQEFAALKLPAGTLNAQAMQVARELERTTRKIRVLSEMKCAPLTERNLQMLNLTKVALLQVAQLCSVQGWDIEDLAVEAAQGIVEEDPRAQLMLMNQPYLDSIR